MMPALPRWLNSESATATLTLFKSSGESTSAAGVGAIRRQQSSTPCRDSLDKTSPAPDVRRIAKPVEFHNTPKHGNWHKAS